jgi:hypothetical protein
MLRSRSFCLNDGNILTFPSITSYRRSLINNLPSYGRRSPSRILSCSNSIFLLSRGKAQPTIKSGSLSPYSYTWEACNLTLKTKSLFFKLYCPRAAELYTTTSQVPESGLSAMILTSLLAAYPSRASPA